MRILLAYDEDDAGQRAAREHRQFILDVIGSWGVPRHPREPISSAIALVEQDMASYSHLINCYESIAHPAAVDRLAELETEYGWMAEHWDDLFEADNETAHSRATSADEYIALLQPIPEAARGQRLDYAALKERIDIVDYIGRSTRLKPSGGRFIGRCPLPGHEDSTPSLWVYPASKSWYCYGCNQGGDVFNFADAMGTTARELAGAI